MKQNRRLFLMGGIIGLPLSALGAYAVFQGSLGSASSPREHLLLSSVTDKNGQHYLAALSSEDDIYYQLPIPERAHDSLYNPQKQQAIYFGRSPSRSIYIVDIVNKKLSVIIRAANNRHFYGHGVIDQTNRYLYVVENDTLSNQGRIGVYDAEDSYKKINEMASFGVGPHQIALLSDNTTLVIANGGILKDSNNIILNKESFVSSLAYIDSQNGELLANYSSEFVGNSLRHLAVDSDDKVYIGAQSHSEYINPLVFSHNGEDNLLPFVAEDYIWQGHNNYTASLAAYGETLIVSSPRGNSLSFWNIKDRRFLAKRNYLDVAGLAVNGDQDKLLLTTGQGMVISLKHMKANKKYRAKNIAWDNHLSLAKLI